MESQSETEDTTTNFVLGLPTSLQIYFVLIFIIVAIAAVFAFLSFLWALDINDTVDDIKHHGSWHGHRSSDSSSSSSDDDDDDDDHHCDNVNCSNVECVTPAKGFKRFDFCDPYTGIQGVFNPERRCPYEFFRLFIPEVIDFTANDGSSRQKRGLLKLLVDPFTLTVPQQALGLLDHLKQFATHVPTVLLSKNEQSNSLNEFSSYTYGVKHNPFTESHKISKHGAISSTTVIASQFSGLKNNPFPKSFVTNPLNDPRFAICGLATNAATGTPLVLDAFQTEEGVWTIYEVLSLAQTPENFYRAFTSIKFVGRRKDPWEFNEIRIEYDRASSTAKWFLDGELVMKIDRPGFLPKNQKEVDHDIVVIIDHGGTEQKIEVNEWNVAIACIDLLDATDPNNNSSEAGLVRLSGGPNLRPDYYIKPTNFFDNESLRRNRLFGQGANATYKLLEVSVR